MNMVPSWALPQEDHERIHLLVSDKNLRCNTGCLAAHVWSGDLPEGSFFQLSDCVYVTSPAFEFLMLAGKLDIREAIAFGNELCGLYSFDATHDRGFRSRSVPLLTTSELASYLMQAGGCRGRKMATRALRFVVDGAASPMEALIVMLLCLPCNLGGYGLNPPIMNYPVALSSAAALIAERSTCVADACWPDVKLDVEYHGRYDHDNPYAFDSDRARVNGLLEMGYEVVELTGRQVADLEQFEAIALHIAKKTGKRIRRENRGAIQSRVELRRLLYAWNRSSGEPPGKL